jgi:hypothetical protein
MRCGVRTVQRYEREFGLPVRRPTGRTRGSVMATLAEIDAWVAAGPIRETFRLARVDRNSRIQNEADNIGHGVAEMRKLKEQMQDLRVETRTALNLLIDRVSAIRLLMPSGRPNGYEPLGNMDIDMDMDRRRLLAIAANETDASLHLTNVTRRRKNEGRKRNKTSASTTQKPH